MTNPGPGFCQVLAFYTNADGHQCQNSCGYAIGAGADQTTVDAISDWLAPVYKAQLHTISSWRGVRLIVGNDGPPFEFDSVSSAGPGTRSGDLEMATVMGLIRKSTAFAGRKFRGRMYIPDMADAQVSSQGPVTAPGIALLQAIGDQWFDLTSADALIGAPQILHADGLTAPTEITAMLAESMVATQRRRYER